MRLLNRGNEEESDVRTVGTSFTVKPCMTSSSGAPFLDVLLRTVGNCVGAGSARADGCWLLAALHACHFVFAGGQSARLNPTGAKGKAKGSGRCLASRTSGMNSGSWEGRPASVSDGPCIICRSSITSTSGVWFCTGLSLSSLLGRCRHRCHYRRAWPSSLPCSARPLGAVFGAAPCSVRAAIFGQNTYD